MFSWINFFTYTIVTAATPGPNNIMALSTAGKQGFKGALKFNLGVWAGFSIITAVCALFLSTLTSLVPKIERPLVIIGAAYMLYLAWKIFRASGEMKSEGKSMGFWSGFALQFVNPKLYIYCIVSMEAYILPYYAGQPGPLFGFAMLLAFIGFFFTVCWAAFGSLFKTLFTKYAKITNTIMALLLVYCAVSLFTTW